MNRFTNMNQTKYHYCLGSLSQKAVSVMPCVTKHNNITSCCKSSLLLDKLQCFKNSSNVTLLANVVKLVMLIYRINFCTPLYLYMISYGDPDVQPLRTSTGGLHLFRSVSINISSISACSVGAWGRQMESIRKRAGLWSL